MRVGCLVAVVAHSGHAAELAMLDIFPPAARMAVGWLVSFFLTVGLDDAGREKLHSRMQA